jgi:hypothetical protein
MRGALVALAIAGATTPASSQSITMDGVARSASLMRQMAQSCAVQFDVDRDMAARSEKAFVQAGEKAFGRKRFARALAKEYPRRAAEVKQADPATWCAEQRQLVIELGGEALFRK